MAYKNAMRFLSFNVFRISQILFMVFIGVSMYKKYREKTELPLMYFNLLYLLGGLIIGMYIMREAIRYLMKTNSQSDTHSRNQRNKRMSDFHPN